MLTACCQSQVQTNSEISSVFDAGTGLADESAIAGDGSSIFPCKRHAELFFGVRVKLSPIFPSLFGVDDSTDCCLELSLSFCVALF